MHKNTKDMFGRTFGNWKVLYPEKKIKNCVGFVNANAIIKLVSYFRERGLDAIEYHTLVKNVGQNIKRQYFHQ